MELNEDVLSLEIRDDIISFNPLQMKTLDTSLSLEERNIEG